MADRIIDVLTPATSYDLMSLDELKTAMGILSTDTSQDAQLSQLITQFSDVIAEVCNRVFAYEEVLETWCCTASDDWCGMTRFFLSHYPVAAADLVSVESPTGTLLDPSAYRLETKSGKVELRAAVSEATIHYSGGYVLPDGAPPALKWATELMIRQGQATMNRLMTSGIRSISHKDSRVQYYDPNQALRGLTSGAGKITGMANDLLMHYVRLEV